VNEILSLWRSPLDRAALTAAQEWPARQPHGSIGYGEDFSAMTVYNYGYYIDHSATPTAALSLMLSAMGPSSRGQMGGLAFVPQQGFAIETPAGGFAVPDQSNVIGAGGGGALQSTSGTPFFHFAITPMSDSASVFLACNSSAYTSGGAYFRSLAFQWGDTSFANDTCIYAGMWNVRAIRCTFTDCPVAFNAVGTACGLEQCAINYTVPESTGPNGTKAVVLGGQQCAVLGPGVFSQTSRAANGATGCTGISVEAAEHAVIADMQLYEWTIGIDFLQAANTFYVSVMNCEIACWQSALNIAVPGSGGTTSGIKVTSCLLAKSADSHDDGPIVKIDANGGTLYDVALIDCTVFNMGAASPGQHGLLIASGANIRVIGGTYSNNGAVGGAGIAITGPAADVQIIGANLRPSYDNAPTSNVQQYALLITGNPNTVLVSGCDMTGYGSASPLHVSGVPAKLVFTDCAGYNDRQSALTALPSSLTTGVSAATCTTPYYGPSVIMYSNPTPVALHIFGQSITASTGVVFLPNPYDTFYFSHPPSSFIWIGK
jgi:hypothetical protein